MQVRFYFHKPNYLVPMNNKWHHRYLALAHHISTWSKDPSTQVGAVIIGINNTPKSFGFNGFPRGVKDDLSLYEDKEHKHRHVIHAETNAILNARQSVEDCTMYITHPPCQHCAGTIVQAGITSVYCPEPTAAFHKRWKFSDTENIFKEAGVAFHTVCT